METSDHKQKLRLQIDKYMTNNKKKKQFQQSQQFYERGENYNMFISSMLAQTISKTLTAPLLRIKYVQQAAFESIAEKPNIFGFRKAYTRIINRYSTKSKLPGTIKR